MRILIGFLLSLCYVLTIVYLSVVLWIFPYWKANASVDSYTATAEILLMAVITSIIAMGGIFIIYLLTDKIGDYLGKKKG